jgi:hypothetical protein
MKVREGSPWARVWTCRRRGCGAGVVVGSDAVSPGAGEWVDDDQRVMAESRARSSSLISSSSRERERLEVVQASATRVVDDFVNVLQDWTKWEHHNVRQREGRRLREEGGRRLTGGRQIRSELATDTADPDEKLRRPGSAIDLEKKGRKERRPGGIL